MNDDEKVPESDIESESQVIEDTESEDLTDETVETIYREGRAYLSGPDADKISQQGLYGSRQENGELELEPIEILHLLERKRIVLKTEKGEILTARDLVNEIFPTNPKIWTQYLVFRDLRSRGYAVRQGYGGGIDFRVYARGSRPGEAAANQLVYVLKDGDPISLHDLDMVTQTAAAARKKLAFALVDQNGEVNFYKVAQVTLDNRETETDE